MERIKRALEEALKGTDYEIEPILERIREELRRQDEVMERLEMMLKLRQMLGE